MQCPQCSAPVNDSQAVFCPRCGSRLPMSVVPTTAPLALAGPQVMPRTPPSIARSVEQAAPMNQQHRLLKIAAAAVIGLLLTTWVLWVTFNINLMPGDGQTVFEAATRTGNPYPIGTLNIEQAGTAREAWVMGTLLGLALGASIGWVLTRRKTE